MEEWNFAKEEGIFTLPVVVLPPTTASERGARKLYVSPREQQGPRIQANRLLHKSPHAIKPPMRTLT